MNFNFNENNKISGRDQEREERRAEKRRVNEEVELCTSLENNPSVSVQLNNIQEGVEEKFICFLGTSKNPGIFVVSYQGAILHQNILETFKEQTGFEGVISGGGKILKEKDTVTVFGTSTVFGDFDKEKVEYALKNGLPSEVKVIVGQEY